MGATADFDGDDRPDVLWRNRFTGKLMVWLMSGTVWRATLVPNPNQAADLNWVVVAAGDANWNVAAASDYGFGTLGQAGTTDIVWRNDTTGKFVVWFMDRQGVRTSGTFTTPDAPSDPLAWTVVGPR